MSHMIELRKVSKFYTNKDMVSTGFSKVDLNLDMGEFVAITGESGSGKSTLLNVISGLDSYEEGELFVAGEDTSAFRTEDYERYRKTYIGNIFQDFNLVNSYTVYQNVELAMLLCGMDKEYRERKIPEYLEMVGLTKYSKTKASKLSGGQKQRVAIARALAKNAPIIVADEPTGNLDSVSAISVMEILHRISRNKLVVIVTHNYEQAEPYVTRKITMHDGRIIEDKSIQPAAVVTDEWKPSNPQAYSNPEDRYENLDEDPEPLSASLSDSPKIDSANASASGDANFGMSGAAGNTYSDAERMANHPVRVGGRVERNAAYEEAHSRGGKASRTASKEDSSKDSSGFGRRSAAKDGAPRSASKSSAEASSQNGRRGRSGRGKSRKSTGAYGTIILRDQIRLGVRNTFNLPAKFILLLLVYTFVAVAVMSQYTSTLQSWHDDYLLGDNGYFTDNSAERIIITKKDGSAFTEADYKSIRNMDNVDYIIKCDSGIDNGIMFESSNYDISGPMYPASILDSNSLSLGRMPEKDTEVVIAVDENSYCYDAVKSMGKKLLGKKYYIDSYRSAQVDDRLLRDKVKIVGVIYLDAESSNLTNGNTLIYVTDKVASRVLVKSTAASSKVTLNFNGTKEDYSGFQVVYPSDNVAKGTAYISEDQAYQFFEEGNATGKTLGVHVENHYFEDDKSFRIGKVFTASNIEDSLGLKKSEYDTYSGNIYINRSDYNTLFNKGNYQSSVFMKEERISADTAKALQDAGYKTLVIKDTLQNASSGLTAITKGLAIIRMALEFLVLFFIAYAVIRLVMRSRNSYYSTLRILGATKRNTDNILRVELLLMMTISYGLVVIASILARRGIIPAAKISQQLSFLSPLNYIILLAALLLMSLLIANRYSRKIFRKSAMKSYREEV